MKQLIFDGVDDYIYVLNSDSINTRITTDEAIV